MAKRQGHWLSLLLFTTALQILVRTTRQEKETGCHSWKVGGKALVCRHNCVYLKKYNKNYLK